MFAIGARLHGVAQGAVCPDINFAKSGIFFAQ
jgi:hypothetical protein